MTGAAQLLRLAWRRDRVSIVVWTLTLGALPLVTYFVFAKIYTSESRAAMGASVSSSRGLWAIYGRPFDLTTPGGFSVWRDGALLALAVGLVATFTVVRHTRAEEESGRAETLLSGSVTRTGALAAAVLAAVCSTSCIGVAAALGMAVWGAPAEGAALFGLSLALTGWVFAGVAAVLGQCTGYARTANVLACLAVGVAFLLRAVGDGGSSVAWLVWTSPLGWAENTEPFAGNRWPVLALPLIAGAGLCMVAADLARQRDIGHGLVTMDRRREGVRRVSGPWSLAGYLQRSSVAAWAVGAVVCGAVFGSLTGAIVSLLKADSSSSRAIQQRGGSSSFALAYSGEMLTVLALGAAACGVQGVLHMRSEEMHGRLGWTLVAGRSRRDWGVGHLVVALAGSAVTLLAGTLGLAVGASHSSSAAPSFGAMLHGALERLPAVWLVVAVAFVVVAAAPRFNGLVWVSLGLCVFLSMFGESLRIADWIMAMSPFDHVRPLLGDSFDVIPMVALTALAFVASAGGVRTFGRRDVLL